MQMQCWVLWRCERPDSLHPLRWWLHIGVCWRICMHLPQLHHLEPCPQCLHLPRGANVCEQPVLLLNNQPCSLGTQCASGTCSGTTGGQCVSTCPASSSRNADGDCICDAGSYSHTAGQPTCFACPAGAVSGPGASSCTCPQPFVWAPSTGTCDCPPGTTLAQGTCLKVVGQPCSSGAECAAGLCADQSTSTGTCQNVPNNLCAVGAQTCASICPAGSAPSASGTCVCQAGFFGPNGLAPCQPCQGGSTSTAAGASSCTCPDGSGATWSVTQNTCTCTPGSTFVEGTCLKTNGQPCTSGDECLSAECSSSVGGQCVSSCPAGVQGARGAGGPAVG